MVRVRRLSDGKLLTMGVCPGCWNIQARRRVLLARLHKMDLEVASKRDAIDGRYDFDKVHAAACPYRSTLVDPWERLRGRLRR